MTFVFPAFIFLFAVIYILILSTASTNSILSDLNMVEFFFWTDGVHIPFVFIFFYYYLYSRFHRLLTHQLSQLDTFKLKQCPPLVIDPVTPVLSYSPCVAPGNVFVAARVAAAAPFWSSPRCNCCLFLQHSPCPARLLSSLVDRGWTIPPCIRPRQVAVVVGRARWREGRVTCWVGMSARVVDG